MSRVGTTSSHVWVGASGYYTVIWLHLVGPTGPVHGIVRSAALARLAANCRSQSRIDIIQGDGALVPSRPADVIYVKRRCDFRNLNPAQRCSIGLRTAVRLILSSIV